MTAPVLRVARASADLDALTPFWVDGAGFSVLARFEDHAGYDGLVLGHPQAPWHLEFVRHPDHPPATPSAEDLLVLYLPDRQAWRAATGRMEAAGHAPVPSANPYWDAEGRTYADPEGRRLVLTRRAWSA